MSTGRNDADIVGSKRAVIDHDDRKRGTRLVPVEIAHGDEEIAVGGFAKQIVEQRIGETDFAGIEIDAGNRHRAIRRDEFLANGRDFDAVDDDGRKTIGRTEHDRARGRFAGVAVVRRDTVFVFTDAGRFVAFALSVAVSGQTGFIDRSDRILDADRIVGCFNDDFGFVIVVRNDLALFLDRAAQLGVGQQVADIERVLDRALVTGEVAARARSRIARRRFGIDTVEVIGNGLRRDRHAIDDELRDDDCTAGDDQLGAVGQDDDEIEPANRDVLERHAFWKDHHAIGIGGENSRSGGIACTGILKQVRTCFDAFVSAVFQIEIAALAAVKIYHLTVLVAWDRSGPDHKIQSVS